MAKSKIPYLEKLRLKNWRLIGLVGATVLLLSTLGVWLWQNQQTPAPAELTQDATYTIEQLSQYPESYLAAKLPQYPKAEVTYFGATADSADGPVVVYVKSDDAIEQVDTYYHRSLTDNGWGVDTARSAHTASVITKIYTRDSQEYHLTITHDEELSQTNIIISWQP